MWGLGKMSKALRTLGLLAVLLASSAVREADGQEHPPLFPNFCEMDVDWDWFEPVYCDCPDGQQRNEGIFFTYERVNWNVLAAPRYPLGAGGLQVASSTFIYNDPVVFPGILQPPTATTVSNAVDVSVPDSTWGFGNRYEFGYLWEDAGWNVSWLDNYNAAQQNVYGVDDPNRLTFTGSVAVMFQVPFGLLHGAVDINGDGVADDVDSDGNIIGGVPSDFGDLVVYVPSFDTMVVNHRTQVQSIELMRMLRRDDFFVKDTTVDFLYGLRFFRADPEMQVIGTGGFLADSNWLSEVENKLFGPQVGLRLGHTRGKWTLRSQGRFLAALNVRDASLEGTIGSTLNPPLPNSSLYFNPTSFAKYDSDVVFSPLGEIRLEAIYRLTQKINVTVGYTGTYAANLGYGSNMVGYTLPELTLRSLDDLDTQHFFSNGYNVGFEINR
jgi:hypothetical protein